MAAFQEILDVLPGRLQTLDFSDVQELRLRVGQAPAVLENGRERRLSGLVCPGELDGILQRATSYSVHACQDALRQGYVTLPGGHRIGVCGSVVTRNGEMTGFRTVSSLCIRFARDIRLDEESAASKPHRVLPHPRRARRGKNDASSRVHPCPVQFRRACVRLRRPGRNFCHDRRRRAVRSRVADGCSDRRFKKRRHDASFCAR